MQAAPLSETLATKEEVKLIHDRLNNVTMMPVVRIGLLNIVAVVVVRLLT